MIENSPAWLSRAIAMGWETALSRSDLFRLTWSEIDLRQGIIELKDGHAKTGKPQAVPIVTPELKALLTELKAGGAGFQTLTVSCWKWTDNGSTK